MCGICGFVDKGETRPPDRQVVRAMNHAIAHRGPDDEGYYFDDRAALAMRRLSVIDVAGGRQPIESPSGNVIVYNGEVYNFLELREELEKKGYVFRTKTDTEVVLHAYEEWGSECLERFNGMFAFAIYRPRDRTLFLARDRCGEKPLYYFDTPDAFVFASELKALMQYPGLRREIDPVALAKYCAYEYVPSPHAILKGVRKLPPGHWMTVTPTQTTVRRYWRYYDGRTIPARVDEPSAVERLRDLLRASVQRRLISDVPLGVFLSGGIDSSAVTALMSQILPPGQVKTFAIGFKERSFDESADAEAVARHCATDHRQEILTEKDLIEALPSIATICDEPFADASIVPTWLLSRFTRRHVTVALGGDGGDELFAGYQTFQALKIWKAMRRLPSFAPLLFKRLADRLPTSFGYFSADFKAKQFFKGYARSPMMTNQIWLSSFTPEEQRLLFANPATATAECIYSELFDTGEQSDDLHDEEGVNAHYLRYYMSDDILFKVDRASMAASLEVRAPFLDADLMRFTASLPWNLKIRGLSSKYILKKAAAPWLPPKILRKKKRGFAIPTAKWLAGELRPLVGDLLGESNLKKWGLFNPDYVRSLVDDHLQKRRDNRKPLWTLLMFHLWLDRYFS